MSPEQSPLAAPIARRGFLALGGSLAAAAAPAACSSGSQNSRTLIGPDSGAVRAAEAQRRTANAAAREVALRPEQWMMHCHNTYHADAGMMSVLSYVR
ncbi:multicopper oxidase domain-containing protein [Nocardia sp. NBC_01388]|uniref:multicopper oxidase domain-containing protein n=1 Tax=Nocardia sp. NBC_01388 TaxID=2903596 RepID=UPI0032500384